MFSKIDVERGVVTDYPPDAFTLVSPDNLDFVHTHAGVYWEAAVELAWHYTAGSAGRPTRLIDTSSPSSRTEAETTRDSKTRFFFIMYTYATSIASPTNQIQALLHKQCFMLSLDAKALPTFHCSFLDCDKGRGLEWGYREWYM